eukprot:2461803-Rhodomonas_salina.1
MQRIKLLPLPEHFEHKSLAASTSPRQHRPEPITDRAGSHHAEHEAIVEECPFNLPLCAQQAVFRVQEVLHKVDDERRHDHVEALE